MSQKNILLLIAAVAVVAIFAFIVASNKIPQQQDQQQNQTNLNNGKEVDISDWQTYRNEEYGFEVEYPNGWELDYRDKLATQGAVITLTEPQTQKAIDMAVEKQLTGGPLADIHFYVYEAKVSLDAYLEDEIKKSGYNFILERKNLSFKNYNACKVIEGGYGKYFVIYIEKDNKIYRIFFNNRETENDLSLIERQIISSFKFIN